MHHALTYRYCPLVKPSEAWKVLLYFSQGLCDRHAVCCWWHWQGLIEWSLMTLVPFEVGYGVPVLGTGGPPLHSLNSDIRKVSSSRYGHNLFAYHCWYGKQCEGGPVALNIHFLGQGSKTRQLLCPFQNFPGCYVSVAQNPGSIQHPSTTTITKWELA